LLPLVRFLSVKPGGNEDIRENDQKSECDMHEGKNPVRKIVEDNQTRKTRNERKILIHPLAGKLPELVLPQGKRTVNPQSGFNRDEPDSHKMADPE
jgi:hypothetical protein